MRFNMNDTKKMKIKDIVAPLEEFAPLSFQESYDNAGLIVGQYGQEVEAALLCVDVTEEVLDEAEALGCGLVISHHPIIFHAIKRFNGRSYVEKAVERAIRKGIALYACHTNLDSAPEGMSFRFGDALGVKDMEMLEHTSAGSTNGFGVVGMLPHPLPAIEFLRRIQRNLNVEVVRHSDIVKEDVQRIALCGGAGASLIEAAKEAGADLYVAADFKYNDFMSADGELILADIGHFESEFCAIELMYDIISKKITNFALHKSKRSRNPINYLA